MGTVGGNSYWELLVMLTLVITLGLTSLVAGQLPDHLKALCPAYPNCDNALLAEYDKIYKASLIQAPAGEPPFCDVNHAALAQHLGCGKRQISASVPLTPGNIPGLVPGSEAAAQWWTNQLLWKQQQAHHVGKRQASVPLTPGNVAGLVPGSPAAAAWWTALIAHRGQLAHHVKRSAAEYPAGVSAAACPNYPFCNLAPIVPVGYVNTAGYPAGVSAAICPGYPYC